MSSLGRVSLVRQFSSAPFGQRPHYNSPGLSINCSGKTSLYQCEAGVCTVRLWTCGSLQQAPTCSSSSTQQLLPQPIHSRQSVLCVASGKSNAYIHAQGRDGLQQPAPPTARREQQSYPDTARAADSQPSQYRPQRQDTQQPGGKQHGQQRHSSSHQQQQRTIQGRSPKDLYPIRHQTRSGPSQEAQHQSTQRKRPLLLFQGATEAASNLAPLLTKKITSCKDWQGLEALLNKNASVMNCIHVSASLNQLSRVCKGGVAQLPHNDQRHVVAMVEQLMDMCLSSLR